RSRTSAAGAPAPRRRRDRCRSSQARAARRAPQPAPPRRRSLRDQVERSALLTPHLTSRFTGAARASRARRRPLTPPRCRRAGPVAGERLGANPRLRIVTHAFGEDACELIELLGRRRLFVVLGIDWLERTLVDIVARRRARREPRIAREREQRLATRHVSHLL